MKQHEGKISAVVRKTPCHFDGNFWSTPDPDLTALLNDATASTSKSHVGIKELAEIILRKVDLFDTARFNTIEQAEIQPPPDGAID